MKMIDFQKKYQPFCFQIFHLIFFYFFIFLNSAPIYTLSKNHKPNRVTWRSVFNTHVTIMQRNNFPWKRIVRAKEKTVIVGVIMRT